MPSAPADPPTPAGRPRWWTAGLTLVLAAVLAAGTAVILLRQGPDAAAPGAASPTDQGRAVARTDARTRGTTQLLRRLSARLERGSGDSVQALAAPGDRPSARELGVLRHNVRALRMTGLSLRLAGATRGTAERARGGSEGGWTAEVQVRWRLGAYGAASVARLPFAFRDVAGTTRFVTARSDRRRAIPLWMLGPVSVARTPRSVVVSADPAATGRFSRLAGRAVVDVRRVLRRWPGPVVVEVPRDQRQLERVLGASAGTYAAIAAVTATADGSTSRGAPEHVFVNPRVFDPLGPRGGQIVMSHETTHVATRAALSPMPLWLLEGFADYVALAHADLPVSRVASQALARVRRTGPPERLPTQDDFGRHSPRLGASYESAWLACRLIARRYGERRLVAFYRASDRVGATAGAFRHVLGTDEQTFTRAWRADLRGLARSWPE